MSSRRMSCFYYVLCTHASEGSNVAIGMIALLYQFHKKNSILYIK